MKITGVNWSDRGRIIADEQSADFKASNLQNQATGLRWKSPIATTTSMTETIKVYLDAGRNIDAIGFGYARLLEAATCTVRTYGPVVNPDPTIVEPRIWLDNSDPPSAYDATLFDIDGMAVLTNTSVTLRTSIDFDLAVNKRYTLRIVAENSTLGELTGTVTVIGNEGGSLYDQTAWFGSSTKTTIDGFKNFNTATATEVTHDFVIPTATEQDTGYELKIVATGYGRVLAVAITDTNAETTTGPSSLFPSTYLDYTPESAEDEHSENQIPDGLSDDRHRPHAFFELTASTITGYIEIDLAQTTKFYLASASIPTSFDVGRLIVTKKFVPNINFWPDSHNVSANSAAEQVRNAITGALTTNPSIPGFEDRKYSFDFISGDDALRVRTLSRELANNRDILVWDDTNETGQNDRAFEQIYGIITSSSIGRRGDALTTWDFTVQEL